LEFLQAEHFGDHCVDVEDVYDYQDDEQDREDDVEGLAEDRDDVCLTHYFGESCPSVVDDLEEVVAKRGRDSRAISKLANDYIAKNMREEASVC
jgi:hypothetical protein